MLLLIFVQKPEKLQKIEIHVTETARRIIELLPYGIDVDLGRTDHPELEEKQ